MEASQVSASQQDPGFSQGNRKLLCGPIARLRNGLIAPRASAEAPQRCQASQGPGRAPPLLLTAQSSPDKGSLSAQDTDLPQLQMKQREINTH